jgi:hypothetical protein
VIGDSNHEVRRREFFRQRALDSGKRYDETHKWLLATMLTTNGGGLYIAVGSNKSNQFTIIDASLLCFLIGIVLIILFAIAFTRCVLYRSMEDWDIFIDASKMEFKSAAPSRRNIVRRYFWRKFIFSLRISKSLNINRSERVLIFDRMSNLFLYLSVVFFVAGSFLLSGIF